MVRNTLSSGGSRVVNALLAIALTPFLLRRLGQDEYGLWLLATTLTFTSGYLNLAELGMQQAAVRLVAEARQRGDRQAASEVVSTTVAVFGGLGLVLGIALTALAGLLAQVFSVPSSLEHMAMLTFAVVGVQIAVDLPTAGILAFWEGSQRFGVSRGIDVGTRLAWAALTVVVVRAGHGVLAVAVVSLAAAVLGFLVNLAFLCVQGEVSLGPRSVSRAAARQLTGHGAPMLVLRILGVTYTQMDRAIVGIALSTVAVARYEVAYKLHATAALALGVAPSAVLPAAAYLRQEAGPDRLRRLFLRGTKYAIAFGLPVAVAGMIYSRPLIVTWVGSGFADLADEARLFLLFPAFTIGIVVGQAMLTGIGRMRELLTYHVVAVLLNLGVSIVLVDDLGIAGVIWGTVAGSIVLLVPFHRLFFRSFDLRPAEWVRQVVMPNVPGLAAQLIFGWATLSFANRSGQLWTVALVFLVDVAVSLGVFVFVGMSAEERSSFTGALRRGKAGA